MKLPSADSCPRKRVKVARNCFLKLFDFSSFDTETVRALRGSMSQPGVDATTAQVDWWIAVCREDRARREE